jgi:nucleoid DNA-binding protein
MNISNHISSLLTFNECVIIPDFGSFISNYVPSQFDPGRNAYLPPTKEIVFNSKITKNDGLLINHLVESESITYTQAYQAISNWVSNAFDTLDEGEKLEINDVGTIEFDKNGSFIFTSTSTNVMAETYGLDPISFPRLVRPVYVSNFNPRPAVRAISNHKNAIRIAAGIALVLSLSLFPMKIRKDNLTLNVSNLNPFTSMTVAKPEQVAEVVKNEPIAEKQEKVVQTTDPYILVGGSFEIEENAKTFQSELLKEGNRSEIMKMQNGHFRVIVDSYTTREKALMAMDNYRATHPESQVWVSIR